MTTSSPCAKKSLTRSLDEDGGEMQVKDVASRRITDTLDYHLRNNKVRIHACNEIHHQARDEEQPREDRVRRAREHEFARRALQAPPPSRTAQAEEPTYSTRPTYPTTSRGENGREAAAFNMSSRSPRGLQRGRRVSVVPRVRPRRGRTDRRPARASRGPQTCRSCACSRSHLVATGR